MKKSIHYFVAWNFLVVLFILLSIRLLPLQLKYLGGDVGNYLSNPLVWSHANYDGDHYIEIARHGYGPFEYFFFPLYPQLLRTSQTFFSDSFVHYVYVGVLISVVCTFLAYKYLWKLWGIDNKKGRTLGIVLLFLFPTSFYFQFVYTEAIFLFFSVACFYYARKNNYYAASFFAALGSATKVIGVCLAIFLVVEWFLSEKKWRNLIPIAFAPFGLFYYLWFQWMQTGDPFIFFHKIGVFGDQRSSNIILLPQVFYRYIFKIIPNLNSYWPTTYTTLLEFFVALLFFLLLILSFRKMRVSYWIYCLLGYVIPTFSGSFSSMPRYVIVLFPLFLFMAQYLRKMPKWVTYFTVLFSFLLLGISTCLFSRGYWLS